MTYRSNLKMVAINKFLEELCPLNKLSVFWTFFSSLLTYIHLIFGTLLSSLSLFFNLFIFLKVMALGLRKILRIVSFLHFCSPPPPLLTLQSQIVTNKNLVWLCLKLELFWLNIPLVGDLVLLAILSECLFIFKDNFLDNYQIFWWWLSLVKIGQPNKFHFAFSRCVGDLFYDLN
jgi:hypothetical protein